MDDCRCWHESQTAQKQANRELAVTLEHRRIEYTQHIDATDTILGLLTMSVVLVGYAGWFGWGWFRKVQARR